MIADPSAYGIQRAYRNMAGEIVQAPDATIRYFLERIGDMPFGTETDAILPKCYLPDWLEKRRAWGISLQLYELRSARSWGIGDFADLAQFCAVAARTGADFVGLNPLHALFLAEPERCSPFSPSSRRFLNPVYLAVDKLPGYLPDMADAVEIARLNGEREIHYAGVAHLKLGVLRKIWRMNPQPSVEDGSPLFRHALFEALSLRMASEGYGAGWHGWPKTFHDPQSPEVAEFAEAERDQIEFHGWLQRIAREQLAEAARVCREAGMRIGLYLDFAVGEAPDGSASWSGAGATVRGVHIGAPPDMFSTSGQDWGLAPLSPLSLGSEDGKVWRTLMQAALQDAGALRIDHVMSLRQQFWIPEGRAASEGTFVRYPMAAMLKVLAELSQENKVIVIGEDLGHVPEGFRETMSAANLLSYRILYFEKEKGDFVPCKDWPALALACLSTHDLPPLKGWRRGLDIQLRAAHGLVDPETSAMHRAERETDKHSLVQMLLKDGLLDPSTAERLLQEFADADTDLATFAVAAHRFIARSPSILAAVRLADLVGEARTTNLPGTSDQYPNWRLRLDVPLEVLEHLPLFRAITRIMREERPR